jgi:hypothetical protein
MPAAPHEILVMALAERPDLLGVLTERLLGRALSCSLSVVDSAVRLAAPVELRPDLLLETDEGRWLAVEVQGNVDPEKSRHWPLLASLLHARYGMGDLVVITPSRRVARWARRVASVGGPVGTRLVLSPVVILLAGRRLSLLFDAQRPELALFAAWAMQTRHGPEARAVVLRALELTAYLPEPLRTVQTRAIFNLLSERMLGFLREADMDPAKIPEGPAMRLFRREVFAEGEAKGRVEGEAKGRVEGEAKGRVEALLAILGARHLALSDEQRARIEACSNVAQLDRWIVRAVTAASADDLLAP